MENEQYYVKVFSALKHSKNPLILKRILKVIKFYIYQDNSTCQRDIINPHTILWMLEIMENHRFEKYLCCLTSNTLLQIVSKHEIHFDYQEVAIIKKFNLALQNIDVIEDEPSIDDDVAEQIEEEEGTATITEDEEEEVKKSEDFAQDSRIIEQNDESKLDTTEEDMPA